MKAKVRNINLKSLLALIAKIHIDADFCDMEVDSENNTILLFPNNFIKKLDAPKKESGPEDLTETV